MVKLSIVIPIYNERDTLRALISRVEAVDYEKEIILIDDFSTDGTRDVLKDFENKENYQVLYHDAFISPGGASIANDLFQLTVDPWVVLFGLVGEGVMLVGLQVRIGPGAERLNAEIHRGHRELPCL